jgi:hypothetical protein
MKRRTLAVLVPVARAHTAAVETVTSLPNVSWVL